jgi:hypothetical protein
MIRKALLSILIAGTAGLAPALAGDTPAEAGRGTPPAATRPAKTRAFPFRGSITTIDRESGTLTLKGKEKARQFRVTSGTRIIKDGQPATLADAKVGDEVGGQAQTTGEGIFEALSLRIGPKPESGATGRAIPKEPASAATESMK